MKRKSIILLCATLLALCCTACHKTCTCYTFTGEEVEFSPEELDEYNRSCQGMENFNMGLTYALCKW